MEDWRLKALANTGLAIVLKEFGQTCAGAVATRYGMPTQPSLSLYAKHNGSYSKLIMRDGNIKFNFVFSYHVSNKYDQENSTYIYFHAYIDGRSVILNEIGVGQISTYSITSGSYPDSSPSNPLNPHDQNPSRLDWVSLFNKWSKGKGKTCMDEHWDNISLYMSRLKLA